MFIEDSDKNVQSPAKKGLNLDLETSVVRGVISSTNYRGIQVLEASRP